MFKLEKYAEQVMEIRLINAQGRDLQARVNREQKRQINRICLFLRSESFWYSLLTGPAPR